MKTLICYIGIIFSCVLTTTTFTQPNSNRAIKGTIDLRKKDLSKPIPLNGEWAFYWKQLGPTYDDSKREYVDFPSLWNGHISNGTKLNGIGYASYKLKIYLPKNGKRYRIEIPDVYTSYKFYINDIPGLSNGIVADNVKDYSPKWLTSGVNLPLNQDSLELRLEIANFYHSKGGIKEPLIIGELDVITLKHNRTIGIDIFLTGCLFMGGLRWHTVFSSLKQFSS